MKSLSAFIQKEFRHILRDRWTLLIIVGMPIAQLLLFGFAITTEVRNASVAVFDPVNDELTTRIIERMNASEYFNVSERITDIDRINDIFREGKTSLVMVFSDNFSNEILNGGASVQLIADGTDPNQASMITAYAANILATCQQEITEKSGMAGAAITPVIRMLYNPQGKSAYNFVPGVMGLILMLICAMMTAVAIVREKETGSMEVLLTSPISPMMIIIAQGDSVSGAVNLRSGADHCLRSVRDGRTDRRKPVLAGSGLDPVPDLHTVPGASDLDYGRDPDGGDDSLRNGSDDADDAAVRTDIPD